MIANYVWIWVNAYRQKRCCRGEQATHLWQQTRGSVERVMFFEPPALPMRRRLLPISARQLPWLPIDLTYHPRVPVFWSRADFLHELPRHFTSTRVHGLTNCFYGVDPPWGVAPQYRNSLKRHHPAHNNRPSVPNLNQIPNSYGLLRTPTVFFENDF